MKVAVIFLDYGERRTHTAKVLARLNQADYHFDLKIVDRKGIAAALNEGISSMPGYDYYAICANDILLPKGWLRQMVETAERLPNTGIVGIHCVESLPDVDENGVRPTWCPFGDWLISKAVIDKIGYFNTEHDPYGMQDSDYGYRATKAGFYNYYIPNLKAEHIGHDVGNGTPYRAMKDESLARAGQVYFEGVERYNQTNNLYLPYNDGTN